MKTNQPESFEEACEVLGINPLDLPIVDMLPEKDRKSIRAYYKLIITTRVQNDGWEPDFNDWGQKKWYLWIFGGIADGGSFCGLSASDADFAYADAGIGARLLFKSREDAIYSWNHFKKLWVDYILINAPEQ